MKLCRFNDNCLGLVDGDEIADVTEALAVIPQSGWPAPHGDGLIANLDAVRGAVDKIAGGAQRLKVSDVKLLSPVANPTKVMGAPVNYKEPKWRWLCPQAHTQPP